MKTRLALLTITTVVLASCGKGNKQNDGKEARAETPAESPAAAERPAEWLADRSTPAAVPTQRASTIRPAGMSMTDPSWEQLSGQQMLEAFQAKGIAGVPRYVAEQILGSATSQGTADDQVGFIIEQAAAWQHVNEFRQHSDAMPEHQKSYLIEKLAEKHGESWTGIAAELDEQAAASNRVMELRLNGIPGMSAEDSEELIIQAIERHAPNYKAILDVVGTGAGQ